MKVLMSIKPEFVEKIFARKKRYEYRKSIFKKSISKIIVYSTFAIQIGEVYPYESPIDPQKLGIKPPQSFRYWNWGGGAK